MLNFRRALFLFLFLQAIILVADWYLPVHWGVYVILHLSFIVLLGYNSVRINSQFFVPAICSGQPVNRQIILTFDDGPDPTVTPQVLDVLKEYQVPATFFCIGRKIPENEALLQRIHDEGHIIGNHSYSHDILLDFYPFWTIRKELRQTNELIAKVIGKKPRFFRPPYGITNPAIARALRKRDFTVVGWNIRSFDTVIKEVDVLMERVISQLQPGGIILFHDTNPALPVILRQLLEYLKANDYQVVSLSQAIQDKAYQEVEETPQHHKSYLKENRKEFRPTS